MKLWKLWALLMIAIQASGCSTPSSSTSDSRGLDERARSLIAAYQTGDKLTWAKQVCGAQEDDAVLLGWTQMHELVGTISEVRLISLASTTSAPNSAGTYQSPKVAYEVKASNYPGKKLLLTFVQWEERECIGLLY